MPLPLETLGKLVGPAVDLAGVGTLVTAVSVVHPVTCAVIQTVTQAMIRIPSRYWP
jgi:hypothetical protein